jgi:hypothetical protein
MQKQSDFKKYIILKLGELMKLFRVCKDDLNDEQLKSMADVLFENLNPEQFKYAFENIKANYKPAYGVKFPFPSDFIEVAKGTAEVRAEIVWNAVLSAISKYSSWSSVDFGDPTVHRIIRSLGGWPEVCAWEIDQLPFIERRFKASYIANISNECLFVSEESKYLPGRHEISNSNNGYKSDPPVRIQIAVTPVFTIGIETRKPELKLMESAVCL